MVDNMEGAPTDHLQTEAQKSPCVKNELQKDSHLKNRLTDSHFTKINNIINN